ncbi:MAG: cytochrome c family protein [Massilia sp.]|nr:cytochrome c family protein [Massilia sp.]
MKKLFAVALMGMGLSAGAQELDGKAVFGKNCAACHQAAGTGIPGAFPALKGNHFVQGEADAVIITVLKGRGGMPTFAESLNDAELSAALSYIRTGWGNKGGAVSADQVNAVRNQSNAAQVITREQPTNVH